MTQGRKKDQARREQMAQLRRRGMTTAEIAAHLGCTRQNVSALLAGQGAVPCYVLPCATCGNAVACGNLRLRLNRPALCLACLKKVPDPTFAQRLRTYRLVAGFSQRDLGRRTGIMHTEISAFERGHKTPKWRTLARLIEVLGPQLVLEPPVKRKK